MTQLRRFFPQFVVPFLLLDVGCNRRPTEASPFPPSPIVGDLTLDWSTHERQAPGSDNWAVTWADDGHQYAAWGDGGGFGGTDSKGRVSLGIAKIEGDIDAYRGINLWGGFKGRNKATFGGKSYGILSIDGVLYMWVGPGSSARSYAESRLHRSIDHGASWAAADWAFVESQGLILPGFLQFGKDYVGARDGFVYAYCPHRQSDKFDVQKPGMIDLARAPKDRIMEKDAWEFFAGLKGGKPGWTSSSSDRKPVFEDSRGVGWVCSVSYNAPLKRYFLMTEHTSTGNGNLGIYDAAEPWGPWTTVYCAVEEPFGEVAPTTFYWNFSNKWLSPDGRSFVLLFTGFKENDSWNLVRGAFSVRESK